MKLLELRKKNNLTQTQVANELKISQKTYSNYENNITNPDIDTLISIADFFNVSLDYLCEREWCNKAYIEVWKLSDEQKANLYLIQQLNHNNNLRASGYLMGLLQEQQNTI